MSENSRANALKNIFQLRKESEALVVQKLIEAILDSDSQKNKNKKKTTSSNNSNAHIHAVNELTTWLEENEAFTSDVAQGYPELLAFLFCHLKDGGLPVVTLAAQLMRGGAAADEKAATVALDVVSDMILSGKETCISELCDILSPLLGRSDSDAAGMEKRETAAKRLLENPTFYTLLAEEWTAPEEAFIALVSVFCQAFAVLVATGHSPSFLQQTVVDHVIQLGKKIEMKRPFVASEQKSIQALLLLLSVVFLYTGGYLSDAQEKIETPQRRRQDFVSIIQQIVTSAGSSLTTQESSSMSMTRAMLLELLTPSASSSPQLVQVRAALEVLEHHILVGAKQPSAGELIQRIHQSMFPEGDSTTTSAPIVPAFIVSLLPTLLPCVKTVLDRAVLQEEIPVVEQATALLVRILTSSARCGESGNTTTTGTNDAAHALPDVLNPLHVFLSVLGGVETIESLLNGPLPMKKVACQLLKVLFEKNVDKPASTLQKSGLLVDSQKVVLSSRCLVTLEAYLHTIGEAENTADFINEEGCRSVLQATMEFLSMLKSREIGRLSPDTIPQIATLISQSLSYPDFLRQCFVALAVMAEAHPYAASMVLDFEFIAEQFAIPDTPTDCNAHIIIGSLQIMQAMVRTAPVVVTFEWVEILAKGVELLPFYERFPDYAPALWYCVLPVMHVAEDALEYFFSPETIGHIASAMVTTNDAALLSTMIQVATFLTPRDALITKAIHDIAMVRTKPAEEVIPSKEDDGASRLGGTVVVSAALVDAVARYFSAVEEPESSAGVDGEEDSKASEEDKPQVEETKTALASSVGSSAAWCPPTGLLVELWDAMTTAEAHTVSSSIGMHTDLLQAVSQCLAVYGVPALLALLDVVQASVASIPVLDRERNAAMRKGFVAATFLASVLSQNPTARLSADVFHRTMEVMERLAGHVEPSSSYPTLVALMPALVALLHPPDVLYDGYQTEVRRLLNSSLFNALVRDVKKAMDQKMASSAATVRDAARSQQSVAQEMNVVAMIMRAAEVAVVNAQYSSSELVACTELLSFVDENVFQMTPSQPAYSLGYGLLNLLLNYDDIRAYWCHSPAVDRYATALQQLQDVTGGSNLAMAMYVEEALHGKGSK